MDYENYINEQKEFFRTHELVTGKRLLYSALLCIFFGFLGVHSFYNRQFKKGILQLLFTSFAVYIFWIVWSGDKPYFYLPIYIYRLRFFSICGLLWAGYDLFLMCFKQYYVPVNKNGTNQFEEEKLEVSNRYKEHYVFLSFFFIFILPLGLQYYYARYWRRMLFCIFNLIFVVIVSVMNFSSTWFYHTEIILYIYILISCLQERMDGEGKLLMLRGHRRIVGDLIIAFIILIYFVLLITSLLLEYDVLLVTLDCKLNHSWGCEPCLGIHYFK